MKNQFQSSLKSVLDAADKILGEAGDKPMTPEQAAEFKKLSEQAKGIREQVDQADMLDQVKAWAKESDGNSAVKSANSKADFSREALPDEGEIKGVTGDGADMYAYSALGEEKLKTLKSASYRKAFDQMIRARGTGRSMDGNAMKVLVEGQDSAGGFWIPPDFRAELIKKMMTMTAVRPNATVITTGTDMVSFPKVVYSTDDKYTAGTRLAWSAENPGSNFTESTNPVAGKLNIPVHLATASVYLTRQMVEDNSFDILGYISGILAETFALGEENVFINGTGAGTPEGILQNAASTTASGTTDGMKILAGATGITWGTTTSGSAAVVTKGILGVEAALPPQYEAGAKWLANKGTYSTLRSMVDTNGRPLWNITEAWPTMANGMSPTLLGYPILKSQFMPDIASAAYPVVYGDLKGYLIVDRVGLSVEVFREVLGLQDLVVVYARKRVGGQLIRPWMLKDLICSAS